jgi:hypothetical protein
MHKMGVWHFLALFDRPGEGVLRFCTQKPKSMQKLILGGGGGYFGGLRGFRQKCDFLTLFYLKIYPKKRKIILLLSKSSYF